jgi:hypothetical protein
MVCIVASGETRRSSDEDESDLIASPIRYGFAREDFPSLVGREELPRGGVNAQPWRAEPDAGVDRSHKDESHCEPQRRTLLNLSARDRGDGSRMLKRDECGTAFRHSSGCDPIDMTLSASVDFQTDPAASEAGSRMLR